MTEKTVRIRALNDQFRKTLSGGRVVLTQSVLALTNVDAALVLLRGFDAFDEDNDLHPEHDFGAFECDGETPFFKIDYYDHTLRYGSDDPDQPPLATLSATPSKRNSA